MQMYSVNGKVRATDDADVLAASRITATSIRSIMDGNLFDDQGECTVRMIRRGVTGRSARATTQVQMRRPAVPFRSIRTQFTASIDATSQNADSEGLTLQATEKAKLFNHNNQFIIGVSYDHGRRFVLRRVVELGCLPAEVRRRRHGDHSLRNGGLRSSFSCVTTNDYFGAFFSDTFDITDQLALTVGGRYNFARIEIEEYGRAKIRHAERRQSRTAASIPPRV